MILFKNKRVTGSVGGTPGEGNIAPSLRGSRKTVTDLTTGQEEETTSSSCRARSPAQQLGEMGTDRQTKVCGYR